MQKAIVAAAVALVSSLLAASALAAPAREVRAGAVITGKKAVVKGFFQGKTVGYFDFGPIKLKPGNKLAPIWTVANGASGQRNIIDTVPGRADYSPLWQVNEVTFKAGVTPRLLKSAAAVKAAARAGDVTIKRTATVVNCPLLGFGQKRIAGFSAGKVIHYYDLGPVKVRPGNAVVPLYAPTNGVRGQHNITGEAIAPGATDYPPLWGIVTVTWTAGANKRLLTSYAAVKRAQRAGDVTVKRTSLVVNCPLVP